MGLKHTRLGHPSIDAEHDGILKQINELNKLVSRRTEDATIVRLLDLLIAQSVKHYANEEQLMDSLPDYADKDLHILEHRLVIQHMTHFKHKLQQEILEYQIGFKKSVHMWLDHMSKYDQTLVDMYKKQHLTEANTEIIDPHKLT